MLSSSSSFKSTISSCSDCSIRYPSPISDSFITDGIQPSFRNTRKYSLSCTALPSSSGFVSSPISSVTAQAYFPSPSVTTLTFGRSISPPAILPIPTSTFSSGFPVSSTTRPRITGAGSLAVTASSVLYASFKTWASFSSYCLLSSSEISPYLHWVYHVSSSSKIHCFTTEGS